MLLAQYELDKAYHHHQQRMRYREKSFKQVESRVERRHRESPRRQEGESERATGTERKREM